jgi:beta-xylosidase
MGVGLSGLKQALYFSSSPIPRLERNNSMRLELTGAIQPVHDPSIIKAGDTYYVFCTGNGIPVRKSTDLIDWHNATPAIVMGGAPD